MAKNVNIGIEYLILELNSWKIIQNFVKFAENILTNVSKMKYFLANFGGQEYGIFLMSNQRK